METIRIDKTTDSPRIVLDKEKNDFTFSGKSLPRDAEAFYSPVLNWFNEYLDNPNNETSVIFDIEYLNSASSKMLHELLFRLKKAMDEGILITIIWLYDEDDEEQLEEGKHYAEVLRMPIKLISKQENIA